MRTPSPWRSMPRCVHWRGRWQPSSTACSSPPPPPPTGRSWSRRPWPRCWRCRPRCGPWTSATRCARPRTPSSPRST
ncbi:MAG: hypothetical protein E2O71_06270 [Deltaproteobacteria bacterium]|nr:MAG: hypothetical protein E2O71_06270 [Deltaproteobacteria bacterium]